MPDDGVDLAEAVERLAQKKRGKGRLSPAPERDALGPSIAEAVPAGADLSTGGGVDSPLVEQAYTGSTFYSLTSSDGLFVYEFGHTTDYIDNDGAGSTIQVKHLAP